MLLENQNALEENKEIEAPKISLWSRSGPVLLLATLAIFLFKTAPIYWPLTLTAFLGYAVTRLWKKNGLFLSLAVLCCISILTFRSNHEHFWTSILSGSIALAWLLIYLGGLDAEAFVERREDAIRSLVQERQNLEKQIREMKASLSAEKHKSNTQASESLLALTKAAQLTEATQSEKQMLLEKCNTLSKNVSIHLSNAATLQQSVDNAKAQITELQTQLAHSKTQEEVPSLVNSKELYRDRLKSSHLDCVKAPGPKIPASGSYVLNMDPLRELGPRELSRSPNGYFSTDRGIVNAEEQLQYKQLQYQFSLLREQFDEKSDALDKARKDLFATENELLVLQKALEEKNHEAPEEIIAYSRDLKSLELTCIEMENQVVTLQEFISALLTTKTRSAPKAKARTPKKKASPDLF